MPQVDEVTTPFNLRAWAAVRAAAVANGCKAVEDNLSPAQGLALAVALRAAMEVEIDPWLKNAIHEVVKVVEQGRGLRVV